MDIGVIGALNKVVFRHWVRRLGSILFDIVVPDNGIFTTCDIADRLGSLFDCSLSHDLLLDPDASGLRSEDANSPRIFKTLTVFCVVLG